MPIGTEERGLSYQLSGALFAREMLGSIRMRSKRSY
jgi:hypothetical protein